MGAPDLLAYPVGLGWDVRHAGCAPKCCEATARVLTEDIGECRRMLCGWCDGRLDRPPKPTTLDRDAPCERHRREAARSAGTPPRPASDLTARDILAAHAHAGLLASGWSDHIAFDDRPDERRLQHAYALADLQLAEKDRQEATG